LPSPRLTLLDNPGSIGRLVPEREAEGIAIGTGASVWLAGHRSGLHLLLLHLATGVLIAIIFMKGVVVLLEAHTAVLTTGNRC